MKPPSAQTVTEAHTAGWIASLILHGALAFGAFAFTQQLKLAPQPTLFQWNVSTVASAPPMSATPTAAAKQSTPPAQAAEPSAKPTPVKTEAVVQRSEPRSPIADHGTPPPVAERSSYPVAEPTPVPRTTETVEHNSSLANNSTQAPPLSPSAPQADTALSAREDHSTTPNSTQQTQHIAAASESQVPTLGQANQAESVKADFGWLNDDMVRWYEQFNKFYPPDLRLEGTAGSVKLRMLLGKDGVVSNVRIAESSGDAQLDQAAIEIIKKTPPIELSRPLGQASKLITFWYRFELKPVR